MEENWIGKAVSIHCDERLGIFQGTIKEATSSHITIVRAFRNGVPLRKQDAEVTLSASDILKLEIIPCFNVPSTVTPTVINKPTPVKQPNFGAVSKESTLTNKISNMKLTNGHRRSPTSEKLPKPSTSKSPTSNTAKFFGNMIPSKVEVKMAAPMTNTNSHENNTVRSSSKPIDIMSSSKSVPVNTPLKQEKKKSRREARFNKNQTFGTPVDDPIMGEEFDFEGNLALFDKQAIWDEIEAGQKPDLVRQAVSAQRRKYRHDENVIVSEPTQLRQIETMYQGSQDFVTDEGLIIPTIPLSLRSKIQQLSEKHGLTWERQCDILARGTTDLAILFLGGARRLTPNNRHQWPTITIVCDKPPNSKISEIGATTGRHLASHGLKVMLYLREPEKIDKENTELDLYKATGNKISYSFNGNVVDINYKCRKLMHACTDLPSSDLVILSVSSTNLHPQLRKWITDNRSSVIAIDPPPCGVLDLTIKCSILPILPLNNISAACGKLYLCNIGIPDKYFRDAGIKYKSPFGHKFVIPIHMKD